MEIKDRKGKWRRKQYQVIKTSIRKGESGEKQRMSGNKIMNIENNL